jgi:hypothetical protein
VKSWIGHAMKEILLELDVTIKNYTSLRTKASKVCEVVKTFNRPPFYAYITISPYALGTWHLPHNNFCLLLFKTLIARILMLT